MALIRSAFWLGVAYMVIGPNVDFSTGAKDLTSQSIEFGQSVAVAQIASMDCDTALCFGQQVMLSGGVQVLADNAQKFVAADQVDNIVPYPKPRLNR